MMVQVDVFWAYGIGASFATAAAHQLAASPAVRLKEDPHLMLGRPGLSALLLGRPGGLRRWAPERMGQWLTSPVALTLYGMGPVLIPVMIAMMVGWVRAGHRAAGVGASPAGLVATVLAGDARSRWAAPWPPVC